MMLTAKSGTRRVESLGPSEGISNQRDRAMSQSMETLLCPGGQLNDWILYYVYSFAESVPSLFGLQGR